jgi:hypothetical protein
MLHRPIKIYAQYQMDHMIDCVTINSIYIRETFVATIFGPRVAPFVTLDLIICVGGEGEGVFSANPI